MEKLVNLLTFPKFSRAYPWRDKRGCIQRELTKSTYLVHINFRREYSNVIGKIARFNKVQKNKCKGNHIYFESQCFLV